MDNIPRATITSQAAGEVIITEDGQVPADERESEHDRETSALRGGSRVKRCRGAEEITPDSLPGKGEHII